VASGTAVRWKLLKDLAEATGGRALDIELATDVVERLNGILNEFRTRYTLTYFPSGVHEGGYHRLEVRVHRPDTKVTARPGYLGGSTPQ